MPASPVVSMDESRLRTIEIDAAALSRVEFAREPPEAGKIQQYLRSIPPTTALEMIEQIRELRAALDGAVEVLEAAGYSQEKYDGLTDGERDSAIWSAVQRAWQAAGAGSEFVLRYSIGGKRGARAYPTCEAALEAALEGLELGEGCPEAIERRGSRLLDSAAILSAWEDRHDPG